MSDDVSVSDLSLPDIEFLRAVRDINAAPDEYPETDRGEVAANTASILKATDLDRGKVTYRIGGDHSRGFEQGELGLIRSYSPTIDDGSFSVGPRSAELTEKGLELLSELDEEGTELDGDGVDAGELSESVKQLKARLDALEGEEIDGESAAAFRSEIRSLSDQVESLERRIESMESSQESLEAAEWGAVDESVSGEVSKLLDRAPAMYYVLKVLFGIDLEAVREQNGIPDEQLSVVRKNVFETLESGVGIEASSAGESSPPTQEGGSASGEAASGSGAGAEGVAGSASTTGEQAESGVDEPQSDLSQASAAQDGDE